MKLDEDRVRGRRERLGLTLAMLARKAGTSKNTVLSAEHGGDIRPTTARKIAEALDVEIDDLLGEPTYPKGSSPFSAERALTLADSDYVRLEAKRASVEELQQASLELARFTEPQTHEELVEHRGDKEYHRESHRRVIAHERLGIIQGELAERGAPSPVEIVVKRHNDAMTTAEETARSIPTERESQEAGEAS